MINRKAVKISRAVLKKEILRIWKENRHHEMTRVSQAMFEKLELEAIWAVEKAIGNIIRTHPSVGKTIKPD